MNLPIAIVSTVVGILSVGLFPEIKFSYHLFLLIPLFLGLLIFCLNCNSSAYFPPTLFSKWHWLNKTYPIGFLGLGIFWGVYNGFNVIEQQLAHELEGQDFFVEGIVSDLPEDKIRYQRFVFTLDQQVPISSNVAALFPKIDNNQLPKTILLSWYGGGSLSVGDRWRLKVKLKRPRGSVNEGGFDYQRWLLGQGIGATGYVKKSVSNIFVESTNQYAINKVREKIRAWLIENVDSNSPEKNFLIALAIGDNSFITQDQWSLLKSTGTSHLMAISGLHIGLLATFGYWCGLFIRASLSLPFSFSRIIYYLPTVVSIVFAVCYAALAGFSLSTQRALVMVVVANMALIAHRRVGAFIPFLWALLIVVILDPLAGYELGFWLSFTAVGSLLFAFSYRSYLNTHHVSTVSDVSDSNTRHVKIFSVTMEFMNKISRACKQLTRSQWVVFLGLFLPLFMLNQSSSLLSPLANFAAIPWVSFAVVIPLILSLFVFCASLLLDFLNIGSGVIDTISFFLMSVADVNMSICMRFLAKLTMLSSYFGDLNYLNDSAIFTIQKPPQGMFLFIPLMLAILGVMLLLSPKGIPFKWLSIFLLLPLFFFRQLSPSMFMQKFLPEKNWDVTPLVITVLDVGQGLAIIVQVEDKTLLYDTGPGSSDGFNAGQSIIIPFLKSQSIQMLDTLIVSHNDNDHSGGVVSIFNSLTFINQFIYGEEDTFLLVKHALSVDKTESFNCKEDKHWQWDEVAFNLIEPKGWLNKKDKNNQSCILMISYNGHHILIPGDIEKSVEQSLLLNKQLPPNITLLIAPHHGSRTSSTASFVNYLKPDFVVFSSGYNSRYGHPHPKVVQRYTHIESEMFNTGEMGQLQFRFSEKGSVIAKQWRKAHQRYWFSNQ